MPFPTALTRLEVRSRYPTCGEIACTAFFRRSGKSFSTHWLQSDSRGNWQKEWYTRNFVGMNTKIRRTPCASQSLFAVAIVWIVSSTAPRSSFVKGGDEYRKYTVSLLPSEVCITPECFIPEGLRAGLKRK